MVGLVKFSCPNLLIFVTDSSKCFFFTKFEMTNIRWGGGGHNWSLLLSLPGTWAGWARVASGEDKSGEADRSGNMN